MVRNLSPFSSTFNEALVRMQLLEAMAHASNFTEGYSECLAISPAAARTLARHADAALRVMKRLEGTQSKSPMF